MPWQSICFMRYVISGQYKVKVVCLEHMSVKQDTEKVKSKIWVWRHRRGLSGQNTRTEELFQTQIVSKLVYLYLWVWCMVTGYYISIDKGDSKIYEENE